MSYEKWEQLYMHAAAEGDNFKMPERIAQARMAIRVRLQDLMHSSNHHSERERLQIALRNLERLEVESQSWG